VLRSSRLLHVKASRVRIFQSGLKTGEGATRMVHVTTSQRLRQGQVKDGWVYVMGYIGPCYPCFAVSLY
jgi:hypothetical protein